MPRKAGTTVRPREDYGTLSFGDAEPIKRKGPKEAIPVPSPVLAALKDSFTRKVSKTAPPMSEGKAHTLTNDLRRGALQLGYGCSVMSQKKGNQVVVRFQAKERKQRKASTNGNSAATA